ncbi:glycosyltransferase family 2 protein [Candidatus Pacearchaeota archaeon]|nr:glycosyltransferase family 2 protein [Candidatus Pacearchaeota archaeon]
MKLSVVMPVYNEEKTISQILDLVSKVKLTIDKEIIIIDDGSTDGTAKKVKEFIKNFKSKTTKLKLIGKSNGGKGSAVKKGIKESTGDIIIIQDADMEYNPNEYQEVINPILSKKAEVVYGSRRLKKSNKQYSGFAFYAGGVLVTFFTNFLYGSKLTDEPTCYKTFDSKLVKSLEIQGNKFEWEPEVTAKILKKGIKIHEVPISYYPRHKSDGKKINWKDGVQAIYTLFYWRFKE